MVLQSGQDVLLSPKGVKEMDKGGRATQKPALRAAVRALDKMAWCEPVRDSLCPSPGLLLSVSYTEGSSRGQVACCP